MSVRMSGSRFFSFPGAVLLWPKRTTPSGAGRCVSKRCLAMTYSRVRSCTLPLALARFTAEFGKGSGGTTPLWSPSIGKGNGEVAVGRRESSDSTSRTSRRIVRMGFELYGQAFEPLVRVSSMGYPTYTPRLSTRWSSWALILSRRERSHLGARFPLRCFQRLSLPYIATRQCHWRDNRNTRGTSTPVLSY